MGSVVTSAERVPGVGAAGVGVGRAVVEGDNTTLTFTFAVEDCRASRVVRTMLGLFGVEGRSVLSDMAFPVFWAFVSGLGSTGFLTLTKVPSGLLAVTMTYAMAGSMLCALLGSVSGE